MEPEIQAKKHTKVNASNTESERYSIWHTAMLYNVILKSTQQYLQIEFTLGFAYLVNAKIFISYFHFTSSLYRSCNKETCAHKPIFKNMFSVIKIGVKTFATQIT